MKNIINNYWKLSLNLKLIIIGKRHPQNFNSNDKMNKEN